MPAPRAGGGTAFSKPGLSTQHKKHAEVASHSRAVAVQRKDTDWEREILAPIRGSNLDASRKAQAFVATRRAIKLARLCTEPQPICTAGCTCRSTAGRHYDFLCVNRHRSPGSMEQTVVNAVRAALVKCLRCCRAEKDSTSGTPIHPPHPPLANTPCPPSARRLSIPRRHGQRRLNLRAAPTFRAASIGADGRRSRYSPRIPPHTPPHDARA